LARAVTGEVPRADAWGVFPGGAPGVLQEPLEEGHGEGCRSAEREFEYSDDQGRRVKAAKGFASHRTDIEDAEANRIHWGDEPPEKVRCWLAVMRSN
jgi:hypothetical protein